MRASQFVKFVLGPAMAAGIATMALAVALRSGRPPAGPVIASLALIGLIATSVGAFHATRRERRRVPRDEAPED